MLRLKKECKENNAALTTKMTGTSFQALVNLTMHANWSSVTLLYQTNIAAALHLQVGLMLAMIYQNLPTLYVQWAQT